MHFFYTQTTEFVIFFTIQLTLVEVGAIRCNYL
jgi:hypothetical protein